MKQTTCTISEHEDAKLDDAAWRTMEHIGDMLIDACGDEPAERLEMRNCPRCGSTLVRTFAHVDAKRCDIGAHEALASHD